MTLPNNLWEIMAAGAAIIVFGAAFCLAILHLGMNLRRRNEKEA